MSLLCHVTEIDLSESIITGESVPCGGQDNSIEPFPGTEIVPPYQVTAALDCSTLNISNVPALRGVMNSLPTSAP